MASTSPAAAGAEGVHRDETRCCEDCGDEVTEWAETHDGYLVCEHCWNYRLTVEETQVDVGEQDDDFAAEEDEEEDEAIVGSDQWWADAIEETKDTGAYALLMSSGAHW